MKTYFKILTNLLQQQQGSEEKDMINQSLKEYSRNEEQKIKTKLYTKQQSHIIEGKVARVQVIRQNFKKSLRNFSLMRTVSSVVGEGGGKL